MKHIEEEHQIMFFNCLRIMVQSKELNPDIFELTKGDAAGGYRDWNTAKLLKKMGSQPGYPDIQLFVPRKGYHGFMVELKRPIVKGKGKPVVSSEQKRKIRLLNEQNYLAIVCYGYQEALNAYMDYLDIVSQTFPIKKI